MAYSYDQIFAADPANPANIATNASITIFAPGDGTMTPIPITDPDGQSLANPITVNANGFGSAFSHATLDRVAWAGGGFTGFFTSYEGMKEEAVAARAAAEAAETEAAAAAATTVTTAAVSDSGRLILTKADTTTVDAGPVIGPTGPVGPKGADGSNVLPTDTAIKDAINNTASETRGALNATYAPKSLETSKLDKTEAATTYATTATVADLPKLARNTVVIFGDSITNQNGTGSQTLDGTGTAAVNGRGYWNWANAYLGGRGRLVKNAGIGGNTTVQMRARIETDVMAYASDWVIFCGGANDIAVSDRPLADIQADITAILDRILGAGRRVLLLTVPPSVNYNTTTRRDTLAKLNRWIVEMPFNRQNVAVADVWRVLADPATGSPATGMAVDGVHPSEMGAMRMGKAVADALEPIMTRRPNRTIGLLDSENVIGNPHMASGTGWAALGTGVTAAYATADDRWSSKATLTITGVTDTAERGIQYIEPVGNGRYAAGDIVQVSARLKWSGASAVTNATGTFRPFLRLWPRLADSTFGAQALSFISASGEQVQPVGNQIASGEVVVITSRLTLPATVSNLYVAVGWQGMAAGTIEVSDLAVWKNA